MQVEMALAILLGRIEFNELIRVRIFHIIKNGVNWYDFLNHCVRTNMVCLVYKNMMELGIEKLLPTVIRNNMRYHYEQNIIRNQRLTQMQEKITRELAAKGIFVSPVKGIKFLRTIYQKDPGVRLLNDVDILASHSDRDIIHRYMTENHFFSYLIDDEDAFCADGKEEAYHFYINFTNATLHDDLRIDFDYTYPTDFLKEIYSENHFCEFCYLCRSYYSTMKSRGLPQTIDQFDYIKLLDISEYYKCFLGNTTRDDIRDAAKALQFTEEIEYTLDCVEQMCLQTMRL